MKTQVIFSEDDNRMIFEQNPAEEGQVVARVYNGSVEIASFHVSCDQLFSAYMALKTKQKKLIDQDYADQWFFERYGYVLTDKS